MTQELTVLDVDYLSFSEDESESASFSVQPEYPCKICLEETTPPFYPCRCNISIHPECLNEWLDRVPQKCCDICRTEYQRVEIIRFKSFRLNKNCSPLCLKIGKGIENCACSLLGILFILFFLIVIPSSEFIQYQYTKEEMECKYRSLSNEMSNPPPVSNLNRYEELNYLYTDYGNNKISYIFLSFVINLILYLVFDHNVYIKKQTWYQKITCNKNKILLSFVFHLIFNILAISIGILYNKYVFHEIELNQISYPNCGEFKQLQESRLAWLMTSDPNLSWYTYIPGLLSIHSLIIILVIILPLIIFSTMIGCWLIFMVFTYLPFKLYQIIKEKIDEKGILMTCCPCFLKKDMRIAPYRESPRMNV